MLLLSTSELHEEVIELLSNSSSQIFEDFKSNEFKFPSLIKFLNYFICTSCNNDIFIFKKIIFDSL